MWMRYVFIRRRPDSAMKLLEHDPQIKLAQRPKELANCVRRSSLSRSRRSFTGNLRGSVGCPSSWRSSSVLTDCFTSSNLLVIRSVISEKCGQMHAERGILAQSPGAASPVPLKHLQLAVFFRRRCSLAFMISFMSPAGRISKTLPYISAGCWPISCTA